MRVVTLIAMTAAGAALGWVTRRRHKAVLLSYLILLLAMLLKYSYYGRYFPVLDDNNMYGVFSLMSPLEILTRYRMYTTRPVASLLDAFLWSRLWGHQGVVLLVMILLHFASIVLLWKVFARSRLRAGVTAAALFALLPFGTEGSYWIAAASRLVVGLFFTSLSLYLLTLYIEKGERRERGAPLYLAGFGLVNLLSLGCYEQVIAFSFAGACLLLLANLRRLRGASGRLALCLPFINLAVMGGYYQFFGQTGNLAVRGQLVQGNYLGHTLAVLGRIWELLTADQWVMLRNGTLRGLQLLAADRAYLYLCLVAAVSLGFLVLAARERPPAGDKQPAGGEPAAGAGAGFPASAPTGAPAAVLRLNTARLLLGFFLMLVPFAPFFLLEVIWICNRNAFLSLLGLSLMVEAAAWLITGWWGKGGALLRGVLLGGLVFACLLANLAEVADYRSVSLTDRAIAREFLAAAEAAHPAWDQREVLLFNARPVYVSLTAGHFTNCTASDWALMGALEVERGKWGLKEILPVPPGEIFTFPRERLRRALYLGIDAQRQVFPLEGSWQGNTLELFRENGAPFGRVSPAAAGFRFSPISP